MSSFLILLAWYDNGNGIIGFPMLHLVRKKKKTLSIQIFHSLYLSKDSKLK